MKASLIIAVASIILVTSCNRREAAPDIVDIFSKGQISNLIAQNKDKQKEAIALLEKGNRKFRVDKNTAAAIDIYTSSITTYPTAKAYFELGNACATEKKYDKAVLCYTMAEQMGFQPVSKLLYNKACAYSNLHNPREAFDHLEYAIEAGFLNKKQLTTDPDLELIRGSRFQDVFLDAMQGVENTENIVWESFMQSFNALVLPVAIDIAPVRNFNYDNSLSFEYEKYVSEMHERVRFSWVAGICSIPMALLKPIANTLL